MASDDGDALKTSNEEMAAALKVWERFSRVKESWESQLPLDPSGTVPGSWLASEWTEDNRFKVYCLPCSRIYKNLPAVRNNWAKDGIMTLGGLRLEHARRHDGSDIHQTAVAAFLCTPKKDTDNEIRSRSHLKQALASCWDKTRKGESFVVAADEDIGSRRKVERLTWCLGQACQAKAREILAAASTIALHQDAREGVLCVRYAACSRDGKVLERGLLGCAHNFGTKSQHIRDAVQKILTVMCTDSKNCLDADLYEHIRATVELLDGDGASDEQRSLRLLTSGHGQAEPLFPNVKILCRDATHSARRLTKNPWSADAYLSNLFEQFISSHGAIVGLIEHSVDLKHIFAGHVAGNAEAEVNSVKNMGYAAHRFDSVAKPLSRLVTLFDSVWRTCNSLSPTP